jgi:bifunctional non-homologous end joining protein LigD
MCALALKRPLNRLRGIAGAKRARFPGFIGPCDPTLRDRAPDGPGWLYEVKIDGYRAQVHIHRRRVTIYSRSGYDWTQQFWQIAHAAAGLSTHKLVIDGEATVYATPDCPTSRHCAASWRKNIRTAWSTSHSTCFISTDTTCVVHR